MKKKHKFTSQTLGLFLVLSVLVLSSCDPSNAPTEEVPGDPDLVIIFEGLSEFDDGLITTLKFKVSNIGNGSSTASRVYVNYINPDLPEPGEENQIQIQKTYTISALEPGEETQLFVSRVTEEEVVQLGIKYFDVIVDPKNEIDERDEINNELQVFIPLADENRVDLLIITTSDLIKTPNFESTVDQYISVLEATEGLSADYIELDSDECLITYGVQVTGEWDYWDYWPEIKAALQTIIETTQSSYIMILGGTRVIPRPTKEACCTEQDTEILVPGDAWYVDFDNDQIADEGLSIGRLPDISYESSAVVAALQTAIVLHNTGGYTLENEAVFSMDGYSTPPYGACCVERDAFFDLMETSDYIRFAGHGGPEEIQSNDYQRKISVSDMEDEDLNLQSNHPVIVAYGPCSAGELAHDSPTLAYEFMKRGAAAYVARTMHEGISTSLGNIFPAAIEGGTRIGPALVQAMRQSVLDGGDESKDNAIQINLYGDPTLRLR